MDNTAELTDIIFTFFRLMKEKMGVKSDIAHLSMVQLQTLVFLKKTQAISMKKIADYLQIELPSATNLVSNLVAKGLTARRADLIDKRVVNISLTKKGTTLLEKAKKERVERIQKVLSLLSSADKKQFLDILKKLTKGLDK